MEFGNGTYYILDDDEIPAKRRNLGPGAEEDLSGLTAIGGAGKASKNRRAKLPDGPVANPLDIFPFGAQFRNPPKLDSNMGANQSGMMPDKGANSSPKKAAID